MKLFKQKKGAFDMINAGMLSFVTFVLVCILVILMISVTGKTAIVTGDSNATAAIAYLQNAAILPPQFASIIVITIIIVGIIALLGAIGLGVYGRMKR
jgi:hypothetical protein